jgi:hypothetical protein
MEDTDLALKLLVFCRQFISEQAITCMETIYQTDRVAENAFQFIEGVCKIAGYAPPDAEED